MATQKPLVRKAAILTFTGLLLYVLLSLGRDRYNSNADVIAQDHARFLSIAALNYSQSHYGHFPPANQWHSALQPQLTSLGTNLETITRCPGRFGMPARRFVMNSALSNCDIAKLGQPENVILFFPMESTISTSAPLAKLATTSSSSTFVSFADGHTESLSSARSLMLPVSRVISKSDFITGRLKP